MERNEEMVIRLEDYFDFLFKIRNTTNMLNCYNLATSLQAVPVTPMFRETHGRAIIEGQEKIVREKVCKCSVCDSQFTEEWANYCPFCGARLDFKENKNPILMKDWEKEKVF